MFIYLFFFFLFRLIPILVNGMKYSEIDIILLKVSILWTNLASLLVLLFTFVLHSP